jgi:Protein of unknown function (DUF2934)
MRTRAVQDGLKADSFPTVADDPSENLANGDSEFEASEDPTRSDIAALAYHLWEERGCPHGSPDDDWYEAERRFKDAAP